MVHDYKKTEELLDLGVEISNQRTANGKEASPVKRALLSDYEKFTSLLKHIYGFRNTNGQKKL